MTNVQAIRTYFEADGGRKVGLQEVKSLTPEDRKELGQLACIALGEPNESNEA